MDFILEKCPGTVGTADDIAVYGPNEEENDTNLHNLMLVAREHGLVFNLHKCVTEEKMMTFFGMLHANVQRFYWRRGQVGIDGRISSVKHSTLE